MDRVNIVLIIILFSFLGLGLWVSTQPRKHYTYVCEDGKTVKNLSFYSRDWGADNYVYELEDGERLTTRDDLQNGDCPTYYLVRKLLPN